MPPAGPRNAIPTTIRIGIPVTVGIQPFWLRMKNLPPLTVDPVIEAYKKDVDRSLLRENLKLTPTQRIRKLMELQRFAAQVREGGRRMRKRDD